MSSTEKDIFFTIVIPTYNRAQLIDATIQSVLQQTYRNYEVIVVDDGSTDNTEEVVKKYLAPDFSYYKLEHGERSAARNFGTSKAKGDYINWFDSDDIMLPNHLGELCNVIKQHNHPALIGVAYEVERPGQGVVYTMKFPATVLNPFMNRHNFILTMTGIVRIDVARKHPFNTAAIPREDHELWLRIATEHDIIGNNTVTVRVMEHEQSGSVVVQKSADKFIRELDAFLHEVESNPAVKKWFNGKLNRFKMYRYSASSYYYACRGARKPAVKLLWKSVKSHPAILFDKEFFSIVKNLVFAKKSAAS